MGVWVCRFCGSANTVDGVCEDGKYVYCADCGRYWVYDPW